MVGEKKNNVKYKENIIFEYNEIGELEKEANCWHLAMSSSHFLFLSIYWLFDILVPR